MSFAPHLSGIVRAFGAADRLVGVSESEPAGPGNAAPVQVRSFPAPDFEALVALRPDLVLIWEDSPAARHGDRLRALGIPFRITRARRIADIALTIHSIGTWLAIPESRIEALVAKWHASLDRASGGGGGKGARALYVVWDRPLIAIGGGSVIHDAMERCGLRNVLGDVPRSALRIDMETAIGLAPEVIVTGSPRPQWREAWQPWRAIPAVAHDRLVEVDADRLHRPGLGLAEGIAELCAATAAGQRDAVSR